GRQVRIEGRVVPVSAAEADAYWESRPRTSRLAASASHQDAPLVRRADLLARWRALDRRYRNQPIPRPALWTGFRVVPVAMESGPHGGPRLHRGGLYRGGGRGGPRGWVQPWARGEEGRRQACLHADKRHRVGEERQQTHRAPPPRGVRAAVHETPVPA